MRASSKRIQTKNAWKVGGGAGVLLVAAACGGSSPANLSNGGGTHAHTAAVVVATHQGPLGTYLTNSSGMSLYMFASDKPGTSTCTGTCASYWPALTTKAAPTASGGASGSALGTLTRSDGTRQVT